MEIVDGYQLLELPLLNVLYILHVLLHKELQQHNVYCGDQLAFLMELHVSLRQLVHHIPLKSVVEMQELTEHASTLPPLVQPLQELADYNYVQMQLQQQQQAFQLTQDVLDSQQLLHAQLQEQLVFHNQHVDHTQSKLVVFKEQTECASGRQQQQLQQQQHQLQHQVFAD